MQVPPRRPSLSPRAISEANLKGALALFLKNDIRLAEREDVHEIRVISEIGTEMITGHGLRAFAADTDKGRVRIFAGDQSIAEELKAMGRKLADGEIKTATVTARAVGRTENGVPGYLAFVTETD